MINWLLKNIWRKIWFRISWLMGIWILPFVFYFHDNQFAREILGIIYISILVLMIIFNEGVEDD